MLVIAALRSKPPQEQALAIPAVPAPQADSAECATLMATLPQRLGDYLGQPLLADPGQRVVPFQVGGE